MGYFNLKSIILCSFAVSLVSCSLPKPPVNPENNSSNSPQGPTPGDSNPNNNGGSTENDRPENNSPENNSEANNPQPNESSDNTPPTENTNSSENNPENESSFEPESIEYGSNEEATGETENGNQEETSDNSTVVIGDTPKGEDQTDVSSFNENEGNTVEVEVESQPPHELHRYWRLVANSASYSSIEPGSFQISEVEMFSSFDASGEVLSTSSQAFSSSDYSSSYTKFKAFDGNDNTYWADRNTADPNKVRWIGQDFAAPTRIESLKIKGAQFRSKRQFPPTIYLEYSDDNQTWITSDILSLEDNTEWQTFTELGRPRRTCSVEFGSGTQTWNGEMWNLCQADDCHSGFYPENGTCKLTPEGAHKYWRLMTDTATFSPNYAGSFQIKEIEMFTSIDLSGEDVTSYRQALASSRYSSGYIKENAFDDNENSYWADSNMSNPSVLRWVGQVFAKPVKINSLRLLGLEWQNYGLYSPIIKLEYSDDGIIWFEKTNLNLIDTRDWQEFSDL